MTQRYDFKIPTEEIYLHGTLSVDGDYVHYADHIAALKEKDDEIERLKNSLKTHGDIVMDELAKGL